eukprot:786731-Amphidinium_carterae.1
MCCVQPHSQLHPHSLCIAAIRLTAIKHFLGAALIGDIFVVAKMREDGNRSGSSQPLREVLSIWKHTLESDCAQTQKPESSSTDTPPESPVVVFGKDEQSGLTHDDVLYGLINTVMLKRLLGATSCVSKKL